MMTHSNDATDSPNRRKGLTRFFSFRRDAAQLENGEDMSSQSGLHTDIRLRVAEFEQATVADAMIPRADIVAIDVSSPMEDVISIFADEAHSRLPVYRETLDDPIGFVHIKDVVAEIARGDSHASTPPLDRLRRDVLYVPASMPLTDLLVKMQASRIHIALVVDEYGGTDGLVSLEDLVEEIVGDIEDEHDEDSAKVVRRSRHVYEAAARMEVEAFFEQTGHDVSLTDFEDDIDTLGGIAFALAGRIPVRGEILRHPQGFDIEIMDGDSRRIRRLRLRVITQAQTTMAEETDEPSDS